MTALHMHNIGLLMLNEGLLTREALELALARKRRQGGSLALNLVLEGGVDEVSLAGFYARKLDLKPAGEDLLNSVDAATFSLLPIEIIYDNGILPLFLQYDDTLVAGLVDPTDEGLVSEASFFSGFNLSARLITVSQMARHFLRLAGKAWKIGVDEAVVIAKRRDPALTGVPGIDDLLEQTTVLEQPFEDALADSLDEAYGGLTTALEPLESGQRETTASVVEPPEGMSLWVGGSIMESLETIRLKPIEGAAASGFVELSERDLDTATISTTQMSALDIDDTRQSSSFARVRLARQRLAGISGAQVQVDDSTDAEGQGKQPHSKQSAVVEGEAVTSTGRMKVLGFHFDGESQKSVSDTQPLPVAVVIGDENVFRARPKTKVPARPADGREPLDKIKAHFSLLTRLPDTLGIPDMDVAQAIDAIITNMETVRNRDEIGEDVISGLSDHYDSLAIFTLNGPRAVVWRSKLREGVTSEIVGRAIDMPEGGILHRISQERVFYFGPLPEQSRIRAILSISHQEPVLVAPIELRSKTILILCLDPGTLPFRSPGKPFERLLLAVSRALERVILLRRRGRRK